MKAVDIAGQRFGRLVVIKKEEKSYYLCRCDCGKEKVIRADHLRNGKTKSCGCLNDETRRIKKPKYSPEERRTRNAESRRRYYDKHDHDKVKRSLAERSGMSVSDISALTGKDATSVLAWIRKIPELKGRLAQFRSLGGARFTDSEVKIILSIAHGIAERFTGESSSHLYGIWKGMHQRCNNPKNQRWKYYGGKGIAVCEEWQKYPAFRDWALSNGYKDGLSIDRIDSDGGYCPENCQWMTLEENSAKARRKRYGIAS
jgi:hypothetical protein